MKISFDGLVVLAVAGQGGPQEKTALARAAATQFPHPRFDQNSALVEVNNLEAQRFLEKDSKGRVSLTREGWAEVLNSIPVIENLRAFVGGARFTLAGIR